VFIFGLDYACWLAVLPPLPCLLSSLACLLAGLLGGWPWLSPSIPCLLAGWLACSLPCRSTFKDRSVSEKKLPGESEKNRGKNM